MALSPGGAAAPPAGARRGLGPSTLIALGAALSALGVLVAATAPVLGTVGADRTRASQLAGGAFVVLGWAALAWGIHRLGRGAAGA